MKAAELIDKLRALPPDAEVQIWHAPECYTSGRLLIERDQLHPGVFIIDVDETVEA